MTNSLIIEEIRELFTQRSREVERYLKFLSDIDETRATAIAKLDPHNPEQNIIKSNAITRELVKTMRANGYLLIYNLVEATMTNSIDAIHRCYAHDECEFESLSTEIRKIALENFKTAIGNGSPVILSSEHPIQRSITLLGYEKEKLFSGNLDAKKIRKTADKYGFKIATHDTNISKDGVNLVKIKDNRNKLAHGRVSFEDCGHETSLDFLISITKETIAYLDAVLHGIEKFINGKSYKTSPATPPA